MRASTLIVIFIILGHLGGDWEKWLTCLWWFQGLCCISTQIGEGNGTHSSTLAWKIPWTEEPGRLQSMGSIRVRHDWATSLSLFSFLHWRRKWQTTQVFLPGESQGLGSLMGCHLWGCTESDTTEVTQQQQSDLKSLHALNSHLLGASNVKSPLLETKMGQV